MQAPPPRPLIDPPVDPLIDTAELATILAAGDCAVLDVRYQMGGPSGPGEYAAGHVPGAVYVDLDTALPAPRGRAGAIRSPRWRSSRRRCARPA